MCKLFVILALAVLLSPILTASVGLSADTVTNGILDSAKLLKTEGSKISEEVLKLLPQKQESIPLIIQLDAPINNAQLTILDALGVKIKYKYSLINAIALSAPSTSIDALSNLDFVKRVELDAPTKIVLAQSAIQIKANRVWLEHSAEGQGVRVAVLDTGIDNEHQDIQNIILEQDFTGEGTDDLHGHGTHVASTIAGSGHSSAGVFKGIAPKASLMDIKVLKGDGSGSMSDTIAAIEYAVLNKAQIISMSLGSELPCLGIDASSLAADAAVQRGVIVVVAAGNIGPLPSSITSPGCARDVITVGAVDKLDQMAVFSSRGPTLDGRNKPDIVAPGVLISAAKAGGGYTIMSGTSMATPMVSGVAALILSQKPQLTPAQIKSILKESADDLGQDSNAQGSGRVNAYNAYTKAMGIAPEAEKKEPIQDEEHAKQKAKDSGLMDQVDDVDTTEKDGKKYYVVSGTKNDEPIKVYVNIDTGNIEFYETGNFAYNVVEFLKRFIGNIGMLLRAMIEYLSGLVN